MPISHFIEKNKKKAGDYVGKIVSMWINENKKNDGKLDCINLTADNCYSFCIFLYFPVLGYESTRFISQPIKCIKHIQELGSGV
jgi:hypothetical protein